MRETARAWSQGTPTLPFTPANVGSHQNNKLQRIATAFARIPSIAGSQVYMEVIKAIRNLFIALDAAEETGTVARYLPELVMMRNWVQHRLLCLPSSVASTFTPTADTYVLEAVRLSLLILSSFAVFPQSQGSVGLALKLAAALSEILGQCVGDTHTLRLFIWASMLGAVNYPVEGATAPRARMITILEYACGCLRVDLTGKTASELSLIAAEYLETREWKDWPEMRRIPLEIGGIGWYSEERLGEFNGVRIGSISAVANLDARMAIGSVQTLQT